ncbi:MAG: HD domain-containing protein [Candidatus Micrarchaeota archaeon]|nr:HD domain-containing protein [Candidatus Micrarchaeota archaeon]
MRLFMKIRDPIHGTIRLSEIEEELLDSRQMQRLRNIRQLAMAHLVYPGANHTRFEHSIGTLFLADKICTEMGLLKSKADKVRAAALLHDVGHVAFSHEAEFVLAPRIGDHEKIGREIMKRGEIAEILGEEFDPGEIAALAHTPMGQIITSDIGADRMDYLLRDSHYTGVAYGAIDAERICGSVALSKNGMVLEDGGLEAAESLLMARFAMFSTVYLHKTVRIASRMLQQAIALALEDGTLEAKEARSMGDSDMLRSLSKSGEAGEYVSRITDRRLFKKAYGSISHCIEQEEIEAELSRSCGCAVLVDVPKISHKSDVMFFSGGKTVPLSSASRLVKSLQGMQEGRLETIVMCEEKNVAKVARKAKLLLG